MTRSRPMWAAIALAALLCGYPLVPLGAVRSTIYDVYGVACIAVGLWGTRSLAGRTRRHWSLLLLGFGGWVAGDVVSSVEQRVLHLSWFPAPSDSLYLLAYPLLAWALLRLVQGRRFRRDLTALLDAAIVAVGFGIVVATFFVAPIARSSDLDLAGRVVSSAYPVGDVLLVAVLVRLWSSMRAASAAFRLLLVALVATLAADTVWNVIALSNPDSDTPAWLDMLWLLAYLAAAAAACSRSAATVGHEVHGSDPAPSPLRPLMVLGCALVLPGLTLSADIFARGEDPWQIVAPGSIVMSLLVLTRMGLLLRKVEAQAAQLADLARLDALTGAPNRRTWDHELGRALQTARQHALPLCVALIDLDHFKDFNDQWGHLAGDHLLRELVETWSTLLQPGELLARYGGEEFGLIAPGVSIDQIVARLETMQALMPRGQQFSAGVAPYRPPRDATTIVGLADKALYEAKHAGRGCIRIAKVVSGEVPLPALRVALQPIVELATAREVGHEALSRFEEGDPETVFARAHREGYGIELEGAAIEAALRRLPANGHLSLNVSLTSLVAPQLSAVLPTDLRGIVLEITEQTDATDWDAISATIETLRERGALIAIDDWGKGYSNAERLLRLHPEILKLDRSFLEDLDAAEHQRSLEAMVAWAHQVGARVCAEGIETEEQWHVLRSLGVDLGQGYYFGRPDLDVPAATAVERAS